MSYEKKVAIIIPFFNRIPLVIESLKSALNQTHDNIEILLVDDGSTEDISLLLDIVKQDNRIRLLTGTHLGASAARNLAIKHVTGDYVAFLDSDDLFKPDKIRVQLCYMEKNNYSVSHTSYEKMNMDGKLTGTVSSGKLSGKIYPSIISGCSIATPTVMVKKKVFDDNSFFFKEDFKIGEDVCLWIDLASQYSIGGLDIPLSMIRTGQVSAAYNVEKQMLGLTNILNYCNLHTIHTQYKEQLSKLKSLLVSVKSEMDRQSEHMKSFENKYSRLKQIQTANKLEQTIAFLPLVSIIIPVFNGANYLHEAIESALLQTYSNIEVIVVNDGSNDDGQTENIALRYQDKIQYYYKENGGVASALNFGIKKMKGDYFSWLSHDDLYLEDKVAAQIRLLSEERDKRRIITGGYILFRGTDGAEIGKMQPCESIYAQKLSIPLYPVFRGMLNGCAMLIHKDHFARIGYFDELLPTTQDYDLWFRMLRGQSVLFHKEIYIKSRTHDQQGSKTLAHKNEAYHLWKKMMDNVSEDECIQMEGSRFAFFDELYSFLYTNLKDNINIWGYAKQKAIDAGLLHTPNLLSKNAHDLMKFIPELHLGNEFFHSFNQYANMKRKQRIAILTFESYNQKYENFLSNVKDMNPEYDYIEIHVVERTDNIKTSLFDRYLEIPLKSLKEDTLSTLLHIMQVDLILIFLSYLNMNCLKCFDMTTIRYIIVHELTLNELCTYPSDFLENAWVICGLNKKSESINFLLKNHITLPYEIEKFFTEFISCAMKNDTIQAEQLWHKEITGYRTTELLSIVEKIKLAIFSDTMCSTNTFNIGYEQQPTQAIKECETCMNIKKTISWRITRPLRAIRKVQISLRNEGLFMTLRKIWRGIIPN